ncbi:hypothetical protein CASFOL_004588 [Castilleja foliolosa]|uniref:Uncharacterized protein n=1 Tax=Castilleja foliolosa TaxID=1961234 RepID=A0ABD3EBP8_9LAMI
MTLMCRLKATLAFADKQDYVRHRPITEPRLTPIKGISVEPGDYLTPIKARKTVVIKQQLKTSALNIRRVIRPPRNSDGTTSYLSDRTNKHMIAYLAYLESDPKEIDMLDMAFHLKMSVFSNELKTLPSGWRHRRLMHTCGYCIYLPNLSGVIPKAKEICGLGLIFR